MGMTGQEVQEMRLRLQVSQAELGERMGVAERTVRRWEADGCPELVARFLVKMVENV